MLYGYVTIYARTGRVHSTFEHEKNVTLFVTLCQYRDAPNNTNEIAMYGRDPTLASLNLHNSSAVVAAA